MAIYWAKQNSSRPVAYQFLAYGGGTTSVPSTNFGAQTYQIRVVAEVQGWLAIGAGTTSGTTLAATATSSSMKIVANGSAEYFTVTPGQMCAFNSTSTSTGFCSVTEMA
jgi:hypothetical protein